MPLNGEILTKALVSTRTAKVLRQAQDYISQDKKFLVTTPNPEIVSFANSNRVYRQTYLRSEIVIPDGVGLSAAKKFLDLPAPKFLLFRCIVLIFQGLYVGVLTLMGEKKLASGLSIIRGRAIFENFIKLANRKKYRVFLYGSWADVPKRAKETIKASYKKVKIEVFAPPVYNEKGVPVGKEEADKELAGIKKINDFRPHMLFIGISSPKELLLLDRVWRDLKANMVMPVGQTIDIYAGNYQAIPGTFEKLGLEWLWRLITGTKSLKRIWISFPLFPLKIFWYKLTKLESV